MKLKAWVSYVLGFIVALFLTFVVYVKVHDAEEAAKERAKAAKLVQSAKPVRVNVNPIFISGSDSLLTPTVPKMPGRNPHGFILLRLALELRGWYVFWHPAIGAECWKPGRRHAYMWIRPNRYYVVLNGKHVPIKLAPVERYGTLWGDSSIGDVVDHALLSASKH
jgi:hypothetical protein